MLIRSRLNGLLIQEADHFKWTLHLYRMLEMKTLPQNKTLADILKAEMQSAEMETLQLCPCGKNGFPSDNLVRFFMDPMGEIGCLYIPLSIFEGALKLQSNLEKGALNFRPALNVQSGNWHKEHFPSARKNTKNLEQEKSRYLISQCCCIVPSSWLKMWSERLLKYS
ncbi:uncharacterized protein [Gorilla gorilla gorilla]|uniref:uncharacterized protein isoform X3 n=1 Tax=Gorilla gorilla gorilla TaxID=9595 RepID=UPI003009E937